MKLLARILAALLCVTAAQAQNVQSTQPAAGQYPGTATNDNASAGNVGEFQTAGASTVSLSSGASKTITSFTLQPGDWDVFGVVTFNPAGTTTVTNMQSDVTTSNNTLVNASRTQDVRASFTPANSITQQPGPFRLSLSTPTVVYLIAQAFFGTSTMTADGTIRARRVR